jgi:hypothetical protein
MKHTAFITRGGLSEKLGSKDIKVEVFINMVILIWFIKSYINYILVNQSKLCSAGHKISSISLQGLRRLDLGYLRILQFQEYIRVIIKMYANSFLIFIYLQALIHHQKFAPLLRPNI